MKKLAIVAALLLVAFTACKKDEEEDKLTADFSVKVGYSINIHDYGTSYEGEDVLFAESVQNQLCVVVYDLSKNADSYLWEWGDGETSHGISNRLLDLHDEYDGVFRINQHEYAEPGIYTITLTVANGDGETDCKSKTVTIL